MTSRESWKGFEKYVAKKIKGCRIPGSGAMSLGYRSLKGDAVNDYWLVECKLSGERRKKSRLYTMVITKEVLSKIEREAVSLGRKPLLVFHLKYKSHDHDVAVLRRAYFDDLITRTRLKFACRKEVCSKGEKSPYFVYTDEEYYSILKEPSFILLKMGRNRYVLLLFDRLVELMNAAGENVYTQSVAI